MSHAYMEIDKVARAKPRPVLVKWAITNDDAVSVMPLSFGTSLAASGSESWRGANSRMSAR